MAGLERWNNRVGVFKQKKAKKAEHMSYPEKHHLREKSLSHLGL
jgi:hypothetical protein